ncbi:MAG: SDR family oxidoreductase [Acidobacteriia bacterium]|nr:SDR family oxidoreductase [Terriglobia bacterium]
MDLGLQSKVIFVAGSSRGIGKGIAAALLDEGARVVVTGRDGAALEAACAELSPGRSERVLAFHGDLADPAVACEAHRRTIELWGAVEALVCNIGSGAAKNGWRLSAGDWDPVFRINLWASVGLVEVFLPAMVEAGAGSIVFVSSIAGLESLGAPIPYSAAKAALERYSKDLARRVGKHAIRVNTVAPGNILFPGGSWQRKADADPAGVRGMLDSEVPLRRFGVPEEIGAAVAFLASRQASFITGACLVVDGGQTRT